MPAAIDGPRHPDCGKAMQVTCFAHTCVREKSRAISDFVYLLTFWLLLYIVWFPA